MSVDILYGAVVYSWIDANLRVAIADTFLSGEMLKPVTGLQKFERAFRLKQKLKEIKLAAALILPLPDVS